MIVLVAATCPPLEATDLECNNNDPSVPAQVGDVFECTCATAEGENRINSISFNPPDIPPINSIPGEGTDAGNDVSPAPDVVIQAVCTTELTYNIFDPLGDPTPEREDVISMACHTQEWP